jgi:quercetin dioxygenase-like cupin family protein
MGASIEQSAKQNRPQDLAAQIEALEGYLNKIEIEEKTPWTDLMNPIPPDNPQRNLTIAAPEDPARPHIGVAGDTYTILLSGKETAGRYCLIDMHVPPGGGPPPHRHDFEESFTVLEGEIEAVFRGRNVTAKAGQTIHIPANAPHQFANRSTQPARLLCLASPAGLEEFFMEVGVPVATRTTPSPRLDPTEQATLRARTQGLLAKYRTELL